MTTLKHIVELSPITEEAFNGELHFLCDGKLIALGRWEASGERWLYPRGQVLAIKPTHFRAASPFITPGHVDG